MKILILLSILFQLLIFSSNTQKPVPSWPERISIASIFTISELSYMSPCFQRHSFSTNQSRVQINYGMTTTYCYRHFRTQSSCHYINTNHTLYVIAPVESLCCYVEDYQPFRRNFLDDYDLKYQGLSDLDDGVYDFWQNKHNNAAYWATNDEKQIPRRVEQPVGFLTYVQDFIAISFNNNSFNPQAFNIPDYCKYRCPESDYTQQKKHPYFFTQQ